MRTTHSLAAFALALTACSGSASPPVESAPQTPAATPRASSSDARGGRLFDKWAAEIRGHGFVADSKNTPGVADGQGGVNGDGTLSLRDGTVVLNDAGHDYRLKNLFGWDLHGRAGLYGPEHMNKPYVLDVDLLAFPGTATELADRLERGDGQIPAFGGVLGRGDLEAIASMVVGMRDGALPRPESIFRLTTPAEQHYALAAGGDAERGRAIYGERCAGCHGDDGTGFLFDDGAYSLGSHARQKAYEDWFKILNGQPGSSMGRQVRGTGEEMTQQILDILAALCDRTAFPRGDGTADDVADGDPRCGAYLR